MVTRRQFLEIGIGSTLFCGLPPFGTRFLNTMVAQDTSFAGESTFNHILAKMLDGNWAKLPIGDLVGKVAHELLGTPYVGWTLERNVDREFCFVTLEGLDCVTLFESSLGLARMLKRWDRDVASKAAPNVRIRRPLPSDLVAEVSFTRYRGGKVGDYTTRLHYTCDWMYDNAEKGVISLVTDGLKGVKPLGKAINYMTTHPNTYKQFAAHPNLLNRMTELESAITERENLYLPTSLIKSAETQFKTGDIVGLVTNMDGMDIAHTGLLVRDGATARFLHASSVKKQVILDAPISEVAASKESYLGIMVARPLEVGHELE